MPALWNAPSFYIPLGHLFYFTGLLVYYSIGIILSTYLLGLRDEF